MELLNEALFPSSGPTPPPPPPSPPPSPGPNSTTTAPDPDPGKAKGGMPADEIVGATFGAVLVAAAIFSGFWWIRKKKMKSDAQTISDGESGRDRSAAMNNNGYESLDTRTAPFVAPDATPPVTDSVSGYPEVVGEAAVPAQSGNIYEDE